MFGAYKSNKFNTHAQTAPLHTVELHAKTGKTNKPLYIRLAKNCPWRFVRCVTDAQHSNCKLLENMTVSFWEHTRAVMQLTQDVPDGGELVCLTPAQGIARLTVATRLRLPRHQRSDTDVEEGEGDDPASDDGDVVVLQAPSPEVVAIKAKAATAARADRANKRKSDPSEQGKGEADAPTKKPKHKQAPRKQYTRLKSRNQTSDEDEAKEEAEEEAEDEETN